MHLIYILTHRPRRTSSELLYNIKKPGYDVMYIKFTKIDIVPLVNKHFGNGVSFRDEKPFLKICQVF